MNWRSPEHNNSENEYIIQRRFISLSYKVGFCHQWDHLHIGEIDNLVAAECTRLDAASPQSGAGFLHGGGGGDVLRSSVHFGRLTL